MSDSVKTSIRKAVVNGYKYITKANGYHNNMAEVNAEPRSYELIRNLPAVNLFWISEYYTDQHSSGYLFKDAVLKSDIYLKNTSNIDYEKNSILADIENYFFNHFTLANTANIVKIDASDVWGIEPNGGFTVTMTIRYKQCLTDPTSLSAGQAPKLTDDFYATSVSVRETLADSIIYNLSEITKANGYNRTLYTDKDVYDPETIQNMPFANIVSRSEEVVSQGQDRWVKKIAKYTFNVYLENVNDLNTEIELINADIEKRLMNNYGLINALGYRTCTECYLHQNQIYNTEFVSPKCLLQYVLDIYYRQDLENANIPEGVDIMAYKAGEVLETSFTGLPKRAAVTFITPFSSTNYAVTLTPDAGSITAGSFALSIVNKTISGFQIDLNSNSSTGVNGISWVALPYSNA